MIRGCSGARCFFIKCGCCDKALFSKAQTNTPDFNLWFLFFLLSLCHASDYLADYLGAPCPVICAQGQDKHFE